MLVYIRPLPSVPDETSTNTFVANHFRTQPVYLRIRTRAVSCQSFVPRHRVAQLASLVGTNSIYDRMAPSASALNFLVGEGLLSLALCTTGTDGQQSQQRLEGESTVLLQVTITAVTLVQAIIDALLLVSGCLSAMTKPP